MVLIIPSKRESEAKTFRNHLVFIKNGYQAFMCDKYHFVKYRYIGRYTTKMKAEQMAILYYEGTKCTPLLRVHELVVTFH